jgi:uncharacterized membrane protein YphA (DoxX/SURF4 family)
MFNKFLRESTIAAAILTVIRVYLGYSWFTSGLGKITGGFDASGFLGNAVTNPVKGPDGNVVYGWYVNFLESFALPNIDVFNFLVPWGETLIGLGLMLGWFRTNARLFNNSSDVLWIINELLFLPSRNSIS